VLTTVVSVFAAIALLMPGFIIAELSLAGAARSSRSDLAAVGQTPSQHDVYLEALCTVDEDVAGIRTLRERIEPERGVYLSASQIARIDLVPEELPDDPGSLVRSERSVKEIH
jgi:hypothetical protein